MQILADELQDSFMHTDGKPAHAKILYRILSNRDRRDRMTFPASVAGPNDQDLQQKSLSQTRGSESSCTAYLPSGGSVASGSARLCYTGSPS